MKKEKIGEIEVKEKYYPIFLIRKINQKNSYFRFKNNEFIITTNLFSSKKQLLTYLEKIKIKLFNASPKLDINNEIYILGDKYLLTDLNLTNKTNKEIFIILGKKYYSLILERIRNYEKLMNVTPSYNFKFHFTNRNLGSNSKKTHTIYLSYYLLQYDLHLIDSVIIHELAHHFYFDHSKKFYDVVYKYYNDYDISRKKIIKRIYK